MSNIIVTPDIRGAPFEATGMYTSDDVIAKWASTQVTEDTAENNGGSTDYYKFKPNWKECGDIIEDRDMNYNQGNIFKAAFCFNAERHAGTNRERELNKIIYFAQRELQNTIN